MAGFATRLEAFEHFGHRIMSLYVVPYAGDMLVDVHCMSVSGAPKLDYLAAPDRTLVDGTVFQSSQQAGEGDHLGWRVLRAVPLLAMCLVTHKISGANDSAADGGGAMVALLGDFAPLQIIGMVETVRRGNSFSWAALWPVFAFAALCKGMLTYALSLYFFLHYVQVIPGKYAAPDNRHVPRHYSGTVVAAAVVGFCFPVATFFLDSKTQGGGFCFDRVWPFYPLVSAVIHRVFASFLPDTTAADRIQNTRSDKRYLRQAYTAAGFLGGAMYLYLGLTSTWGIHTYYLSGVLQLVGDQRPKISADTAPARNQHLIAFSSGLFWQFLHFRDLKYIGRLRTSLLGVVIVLGTTALLFGPGAAMALGWAWREQVLV